MHARKPKAVKEAPPVTSVAAKPDRKDAAIIAPPASRKQIFNDICARLSEFFDAGVITVTWVEGGDTFRLSQELGNKFAVTGLIEQLSMEQADALVNADEDDEDDYRSRDSNTPA